MTFAKFSENLTNWPPNAVLFTVFLNFMYFWAVKNQVFIVIFLQKHSRFSYKLYSFLIFPIFCFECSGELAQEECEEDYYDIEYHVVDGLQMGWETNNVKGHIPTEYFEEETDGDNLVVGRIKRSNMPQYDKG